MSERGRLIGAGGVTAASLAVIASVRNVDVDAADGAVLVAALAVLARTAIRLASEAGPIRRDKDHQR
jgi:hypothetical protein